MSLGYFREAFAVLEPNVDQNAIEEYLTIVGHERFSIDEIPGEKPVLRLFYPDMSNIQRVLDELTQVHQLHFSISEAQQEKDWLKSWLETMRPFEMVEGLMINPLDDMKLPELKDYAHHVLQIIPGTAFGTGLHETTKLAMTLLKTLPLKNKSLLDIGCGSGILALHAWQLGARPILGCDYDPLAVERSREMAMLNHIDGPTFHQSDLLVDVEPKKYDIIVANIVAEVLHSLLESEEFLKFVKKDTDFILSGIAPGKNKGLETKLEEMNFSKVQEITMGEWTALHYRY